MNEDIIRDLYYAQNCELMRAEVRHIIDSLSPTDRQWLDAGYNEALSNLVIFYITTMSSEEAKTDQTPVSYTHLTLPTICSV